MPGKKDEFDLEASFFGDDDMSWLEDDETNAGQEAKAAEPAPAPALEPEPVAAEPEPEPEPIPEPVAAAATKDDAPLMEQPAPVLTPPEEHQASLPPRAPAPPPPVPVADAPIEQPAPAFEDLDRVDSEERKVKAQAWAPPPAAAAVVDEDDELEDFEELGTEAVSEVDVSEPDVDEPEAEPEIDEVPSILRPVAGFTQGATQNAMVSPEAYLPASDEEEWRDVARTLLSEAAVADSAERRARLLFEAGRVYRTRLGDWEGAEVLFNDALAASQETADLLRNLADAVARRGAWDEVRSTLARRLGLLEGAEAAEAAQDLALLLRNRLGRVEEAVDQLTVAQKADADDFFTLRLLREQLAALGRFEELVAVLEHMAELCSGQERARLLTELGRVHEQRLDDLVNAEKAYTASLEANPGHAPALLALERMFRASADDVRLAELYETEAQRDGQTVPGFYFLKAARLWRNASQQKRAEAAYKAASAVGVSAARREYQSWLAEVGRFKDLAAELRAEADGLAEGPARAYALFSLGRVLETALDDKDGALTAYREAVAQDPAAGPAAEAVARTLSRGGRHEELLTFWEGRLEGAEPAVQAAVLYRAGEVAEGSLADVERARGYFERVLAVQDDHRPALEGLQRVCTAQGAWDRLAEVFSRRAELAVDDAARVLEQARAGSAFERAGQAEPALTFYRAALRTDPAFPPALDGALRLMAAAEDYAGVAAALRAAGDASADPAEKATLLYRSARVSVEKTGDLESATACLREAVEADSSFLPAVSLLKEIAQDAGASGVLLRMHTLQAEASQDPATRHWRLLAAADVAQALPDQDPRRYLLDVLEEAPSHPGALTSLERRCLADGDLAGLARALSGAASRLEPGAERLALQARVVDLAESSGEEDAALRALTEAVAAASADAPVRGLAHLAASLLDWRSEVRLLSVSAERQDQLEQARALEEHLGDLDGALAIYESLLAATPDDVTAAAGVARLAQRLGQRERLGHAYAVLAEHTPDAKVAAMYAMLAGHLAETDGDPEAALGHYSKALAARPRSAKVFDAVRRLQVAGREIEALEALYAAHRPDDRVGLAEALEEAGEPQKAADVWGSIESDNAFYVAIREERARALAEDWHGAFLALTRAHDLAANDNVRERFAARQRWMLAEHLAETEEAWTFYRQLHDESPEDREVLEALARIATARGETQLALTYLQGLADTADTDEEKARYQRRVGDAYAESDQIDAARQAYLDALDYRRDDMEALAGLEALAEKTDDWQAQVDVLKRRAQLLGTLEATEVWRTISNLLEANAEPSIAMEAWTEVLERVPVDREALEHIVALAEASASWDAFVQRGQELANLTEGEERRVWMRRIGLAAADHLGREDAVRFLEAAVQGEKPDVQAAERLEVVYRARGDLAGAMQARLWMARGADSVEDRVTGLLQVASLQLTERLDREAAAAVYHEILELDPDQPDALRFQADHLFAQGRTDEALPLFEKLAPSVEEGADLEDFDVQIEVALFWFRLGELLRAAGRNEEALERFERALELNSTHLPSLGAVGPLYMEQEEWKKAEKVYRQVLQLTGGQGDRRRLSDTYVQLGLVERALGNTDKASKRFNKAMELTPNHVGALKGTAKLLEDKEDWGSLLNIYNNIIYHATSPDDVILAYMTKGRILDSKMGRPDKAAQHYERSLAFDANQPLALLRLAELSMRRSEWSEVGGLAQKGLQLVSEASDVRAELLLCWAAARKASGDEEGANAALTEARANASRDIAEDVLAELEAFRVALLERLPK